MTLFALLGIFWSIRTAKAALFWIYLWQLKDYHIGRFVDHFRTAKGKQIFLNPLFLSKLLLFVVSFFYPQIVVPVLVVVYLFETVVALKAVLLRTLLRPVWTKKAALLIILGLGVEVVFLWVAYTSFQHWYLQLLLGFDIVAPKIFSFLVLFLQPWVVVMRNRVIEKARKKREQFPNLLVIGITGSYGKTTTKEFLAHILSRKFKVLKTKEHQNSEVGISQCILNELRPEHEVFVCEMGAYNRGGIKLLSSIAKPRIGVLCGINEQHMATFGSQENIIKAKYELIESLPSNGVAFFNAKNTYCVELYDKTIMRKVLYGQNARFQGEENILGAMAVAKELGMSEEDIAKAVTGIENIFPGAQVKKGKNGITVIDATYSANPDGVMANLEYLKTFPGKKVLVMPCLIELGSASKEAHRRIGGKIAEVCDLALITSKDRFGEIQEGVRGSVQLLFVEDPDRIVAAITSTIRPGDVVLLEGRVPLRVLELLLGNC